MSQSRSSGGVTWRALVLGVVLIPLNCIWVTQMELIWYSGHPTTTSIFFNVVFTLLTLIVLNSFLKQARPAWALAPQELLVVYIMVAIGSALTSHDLMQILVPMLGHIYQFATPSNRWAEIIQPYLPTWLFPSKLAIADIYKGGTLYTRAHLLGWLSPVLGWSGFMMVLLFMMICLNTLLRKQWERERLTYPLVELPLRMVDPNSGLFRDKLMWGGFALVGSITVLNGFAALYPSVPELHTRFTDLGPYFRTRPWNALGGTRIAFYPFAIGLGFILPVDMLFSCWFFLGFWKAQLVLTSLFAFDTRQGFPFINQQATGAYLGLCAFTLWTARKHLAQAFQRAWRGEGEDDRGEPISYRTAFVGLIIGFILLMIFCVVIKLSLFLAVVFFLIYFAISITVTRVRAELGPPAHDLHFSGPEIVLTDALGTENIDRHSLTIFSLFFWFNRAYRSHPMPIQLEGLKLAERTGIPKPSMMWALMLAGFVGILGAFWAHLHLLYHYGEGTANVGGPAVWAFGPESWNRLTSWLNVPTGPEYGRTEAVGVGTATVIFLSIMRIRYVWWPFHPVGYAVSSSWSMNLLWCPLLIAWLCKVMVLRYGGLRLYRRAIPLFLGLVLGEFVVGSLWTIAGMIWSFKPYGFWV